MKRHKHKNTGQSSFSFWENILIHPLQAITDIFSANNRQSPVPASRSISLGQSTNIYNRKQSEEVFLNLKTLKQHGYILGQSGSGKTFLILLLLMSFIRLGCGFCIIDIHGDLSQMILAYIASISNTAPEYINNVGKLVLIEFFDRYFAPAFNPLHSKDIRYAYRETADMLGIIKQIWKDVAWGARMEELLRNLLLTLSLSRKTLAEAPLFLTNEDFRTSIVRTLSDPELIHYWTNRFGVLSERMKPVYVDPVLNKLSVFTSDPYIRHSLAQDSSSLDFRKLMDQQKWVIVNISKGVLSQNAHLLGSLLISKIKAAAMSRVDIPQSRRVPFYLVVDEFQNFMGYNFEEILSEARKYCLSLILAHQNLAQIDKKMRESILGNVATTMFFRLGHNDIREISNEFKVSDQALLKQTVSTLGVGEVVKRETDGSFRKINVHHISPEVGNLRVINQLRDASRAKYCKRRSIIDAELSRSHLGHNAPATIISRPGSRTNQVSADRNNADRPEGEL